MRDDTLCSGQQPSIQGRKAETGREHSSDAAREPPGLNCGTAAGLSWEGTRKEALQDRYSPQMPIFPVLCPLEDPQGSPTSIL